MISKKYQVQLPETVFTIVEGMMFVTRSGDLVFERKDGSFGSLYVAVAFASGQWVSCFEVVE